MNQSLAATGKEGLELLYGNGSVVFITLFMHFRGFLRRKGDSLGGVDVGKNKVCWLKRGKEKDVCVVFGEKGLRKGPSSPILFPEVVFLRQKEI